jgi:hypothetical protein
MVNWRGLLSGEIAVYLLRSNGCGWRAKAPKEGKLKHGAGQPEARCELVICIEVRFGGGEKRRGKEAGGVRVRRNLYFSGSNLARSAGHRRWYGTRRVRVSTSWCEMPGRSVSRGTRANHRARDGSALRPD